MHYCGIQRQLVIRIKVVEIATENDNDIVPLMQ